MTSSWHCGRRKQQGLALLVLVIIIFLAMSAYYFSSVSLAKIQTDKIERTQLMLKRAKQALLAYARTRWYQPGAGGKLGKLPCPDYNDNGVAGEQDGNCGNAYANAIGYFPWRTVAMEITKDSSGSCLLYAVSPAYKSSPVAALNPDSYGQFRIVNAAGVTVQGALPEDRPVAVILAPEETLPAQTRENNSNVTCGSYYGNNIFNLIAAYLDNNGTTNNAAINPAADNNIENFVAAYAGSDEAGNPLNDRLITITHREFWAAMQSTITGSAFDTRMKNLTEAVALCFAEYGKSNGRHLPMPAPLALNEYRKSSDYDDSGDFTKSFAGRLPYDVSMANAKLNNGNNYKIFNNTYCDVLNLPSTSVAEAINLGDDLASDAGSDQGEYFDLWSNWKDHFFYAISKDFNPSSSASCSGDCVKVNGNNYAAIVFFSGLKRAGQLRYAPPFEADKKSDIVNYLENDNAPKFPDNTGDANYNNVGLNSNDIMFCIKPDMSVIQCL